MKALPFYVFLVMSCLKQQQKMNKIKQCNSQYKYTRFYWFQVKQSTYFFSSGLPGYFLKPDA